MKDLSLKNWMEIYPEEGERLSPKSRATLGYWDPVFYCRFFLGEELFPLEMPWFHRGLLAILTGKTGFLSKYGELEKIASNFIWEDSNKVWHNIFEVMPDGSVTMDARSSLALMIPRGASKTTLAGIAVPSWKIAYEETRFIVYISEASTHARMQLDTVKTIFTVNESFKESFGELKPKMSSDERWSQDFFETVTGIAMMAQGRGGQIRGKLHKGKRPTDILVDDLEDIESVATKESRLKARQWFYADVIPALPKVIKTGTITFLGTMLHPEAVLNSLRNDKKWAMVEFGAYDRDGDLLWPQWMNEEELQVERASYLVQGLLSTYYMEYFSQYRAPEGQPFKQEYFHNDIPPSQMQTAIYVDPAVSKRRQADRTWIIAVGMAQNGFIYVLETWFKRGASPSEIIDQYFAMAMRYECNPEYGHGFEAVAYQAALGHLMTEMMFRKGYYFKPVPITHARKTNGPVTKKEDRIQLILQPRYAAGYIQHVGNQSELEGELLDFPIGKHDDGPDCLAGAIALLDPFAAQAAGEFDLGAPGPESLEDWLGVESMDDVHWA